MSTYPRIKKQTLVGTAGIFLVLAMIAFFLMVTTGCTTDRSKATTSTAMTASKL